jgi:amidase
VAIHDLTALECAAAIRRREVSVTEVVDHCLTRIEALNDVVGAFTDVLADTARATAAVLDEAVSRAHRDGDVDALPLLHGVPVGVKELVAVAGVAGSAASAALDPIVADHDANVVAAMRSGHLVLMGMTAASEFGLAAYTDPDGRAPSRTPWDLARSAGGSSGGSGAAVAAGLVALAHGNDGGGSVRTPASACGLVGLKPSRGRVSNGPRMPEGPGLAVQGVLTRSVGDAAAWLDCVTRRYPDDLSFLSPPAEPFLVALSRDLRPLRLGRCAVPLLADVDLHPDVAEAYDAMSRLLVELGHDVVDVAAPFGRDAATDFETVWAVGAASVPIPAEREPLLRPLARWLRERGRSVSAVDYASAVSRLQVAARAALQAADDYAAVLVPTLAAPPVGVDDLRDDADPAADFAAQERFNPFSAAYNLTGQPAITVPAMWSADGLPIGMQFVGRTGDEATLFALAHQVEAARPWRDRHPVLW